MDLVMDTLRAVSSAIVEPKHFFMVIILGIIFYLKNIKIVAIQKMTIGDKLNSPIELTCSQLVLGILAGAGGSVLLNLLGVTFSENSGIGFIFIVSILLLYFKKRFVCFSYSGAVIGLLSIVMGIVYKTIGKTPFLSVNIMSLVTLVGVLHIVEGILVMIDGSRGAIPVFTKKGNKIVGGFSFSRYWAIPIALLMMLSNDSFTTGTIIANTPTWWPIINKKEVLDLLTKATIICFPLYGMVGYNTFSFTKNKKAKAISSGICVFVYGLSLIAVAQIANIKTIGELIAIIYMPIGHELMLKYQKYVENKGEYLYVSDDEGITVLEVAPNSPAFNVGIRGGDKILAINGHDIIGEADIFNALKNNIFKIPLKVKRTSGEIKEYIVQPRNKRIGVLLVPKMVKVSDMVDAEGQEFKKILDELRKKK